MRCAAYRQVFLWRQGQRARGLHIAAAFAYGWRMDSGLDYWTAYELLDWQVELGADEAILDAPVNRYDLVDEVRAKPAAAPAGKGGAGKPAAPPPVPEKPKVNAVAEAEKTAAAVDGLPALIAATSDFAHCDLRKGARNCVVATGNPAARVMVITEPPSRDDDRAGALMSGDNGAFFDKMFAAIGLSRISEISAQGLYLVSVVPWCPPATSGIEPAVLAMMTPFLKRHIELAAPEVIVAMGNTPCRALLGKDGTSRLRGNWETVDGRPVLPMMDPVQIMRTPNDKRNAWADLLSLKAKLDKG